MALTTTNYRADYVPDGDGIVVDLSDHADTLMNYGDISSLLTPEQEQRIVDYVRSAVQMSYDRISRRYDHWKQADRAHDVYVPPNATAFREKAVIADTRAIADTVQTYLMAALTGRNPMFQLEGLNRQSRKSSAIIERLLHQQMRRTAGEARLAQHLLDSIRYGYAPTKVTWDATSRTNQITNFDPRRVFHDPASSGETGSGCSTSSSPTSPRTTVSSIPTCTPSSSSTPRCVTASRLRLVGGTDTAGTKKRDAG